MFISREAIEDGRATLPWWMFRRQCWYLCGWEVGGPITALRWLLQDAYFSFVRYCGKQGMPRFTEPGMMFTPGKFWLAFWRWCQPRRETTKGAAS